MRQRVGLAAAVSRSGPDGEPFGGWQPQERVSREEALAAYTVGVPVAVWRSRAAPHRAFLARLATLAWADNAALVIGSLQLELIPRVLRHV